MRWRMTMDDEAAVVTKAAWMMIDADADDGGHDYCGAFGDADLEVDCGRDGREGRQADEG